jgi:hypothetical protein
MLRPVDQQRDSMRLKHDKQALFFTSPRRGEVGMRALRAFRVRGFRAIIQEVEFPSPGALRAANLSLRER